MSLEAPLDELSKVEVDTLPLASPIILLNSVACSSDCLTCDEWMRRWAVEGHSGDPAVRCLDEGELLAAVARASYLDRVAIISQCGIMLTRPLAAGLDREARSAPEHVALVAPLLRSSEIGLHHPMPFPEGGWLVFRHGEARMRAAEIQSDWDPVFPACFAVVPECISGSGALDEVRVAEAEGEGPFNVLSERLRLRGFRLKVTGDLVAYVHTAGAESPSLESGRSRSALTEVALLKRRGDRLRRTRALALVQATSGRFDLSQRVVLGDGILFDLRGIGAGRNGTALGGIALLDAIHQRMRGHTILVQGEGSLLTSLQSRWPKAEVRFEPDWLHRYALAFRVNQIWGVDDLRFLHELAGIQSVWMLDKILWDAEPHSLDLGYVNQAIASTFDGVAFLTQAAKERFCGEFPRPAGLPSYLLPNSMSPVDYKRRLRGKGAGAILVVGNSLAHKDVEWARQLISRCFPYENVTTWLSPLGDGSLSEQQIHETLSGAKALVFPSHYEGFGMPLIEAAAYGVHLVTRDTSVAREVCRNAGLGGVSYFRDDVTLMQAVDAALKSPVPAAVTRTPGLVDAGWRARADALLSMFSEMLQSFDGSLFAARDALLRTTVTVEHS